MIVLEEPELDYDDDEDDEEPEEVLNEGAEFVVRLLEILFPISANFLPAVPGYDLPANCN